jgi:small GTP-binding protein
MSKKIVFVGPPGAGKTTLRKIFFEYENAEYLMQNPLDPTYGIESIVLRKGQNIGVFDLAGQENDKWFSDEGKDIFADASVILIILDCTSDVQDMLKFIAKTTAIRNETCPDSLIYVLVHKIDLLDENELEDKKRDLLSILKSEPRLRTEFTSVKSAGFTKTLDLFKDLMQLTLDEEIHAEQLDDASIKLALNLLAEIKADPTLTVGQLAERLNVGDDRVTTTLEFLEQKDILKRESLLPDARVLIPSEASRDYIEYITSFSSSSLGKIEEKCLLEAPAPKLIAPPVIGFLLANTDGISLLSCEVREGAFQEYIGIQSWDELSLVAPFISALGHFSKQMNVVNMGDFRLKGEAVTLCVLTIKEFQITLFVNKDINFDKIKEKIVGFFTGVIVSNNDRLSKDSLLTATHAFGDLEVICKRWLVDLNKMYADMVKNMKIFDFDQARSLYDKIEDISSTYSDTSKYTDKIRNLKTRIITAIFNKDIREIREIAKFLEELEGVLQKTSR